MKQFAILLCICLLLGGCVAQPAPQQTNPSEQITPDCELPPETTDSAPDYPEPPTGTAPEIDPEGLPAPAL